MKKYLLFVIMFLGCLNATAQEDDYTLVSIYKVNYEGASGSDYSYVRFYSTEDYGATLEMVSDGLAITNPQIQDQAWKPQVMVTDECLTLEEGHNYIVRLTLKIPSDGTYQIVLGSWTTNYMCQVPVTFGNDFQIIDVEYPEYKNNAVGAHIFLGCGLVVGTTILKEIEVLEKRNTTDIQSIKVAQSTNNTIYNLAGQKVNTSYKGIVIQNGKKVVITPRNLCFSPNI